MVQQERARVTRDKIMFGAADVIRRVGYAAATLGEIGEAAGVTKGALYFHFASKEEIARALIEEQHSSTRAAAVEIIESGGPAVELMMRLCADLAVRLVDDPIVRAGITLTTDTSTLDTPLQDPYRDWMGTFEELASQAERAGETKTRVKPDALARFIIPAFTGVQLVSETFSERKDLLERVHEMWQVLLAAIVAPDALDDWLAVAESVFTAPQSSTV
ncbi:ScbR family autoregulator-binding transcription factor [Agromyces allii]|uniref:ScbR family autoregulator-binding transcription factor n=1 Tax=Agromyces allii TaxID=393607 RepID=A0ABN2QK43_9MICO|nr:ScbR family autoregulator-binding transcription factor [Agromyces allii]